MLPKLALVGRPNVGKSALFNRIAQKRLSIVDEEEGITRDRLYAKAELFGREFELIDTGGIDLTGKVPFNEEIRTQALFAVEEADVLLFVVDGRLGLTALDMDVAKILRKSHKPVVVAINKMDRTGPNPELDAFRKLGLPELIAVSATQGLGVAELLEAALAHIPLQPAVETPPLPGIRVAIVGRPNVGKSTLLNQLLGESRAIVSPIAGTTRDAIDVPLRVGEQDYVLIDTAGIRRKSAEKEVVDKFAAIRTEEAIERAEVCLLVLDAFEGFTTQEKRIASAIEEKGKSCIIVFNKWDLVKGLQMEHALRGVREAVPFLSHCPTLFISAENQRNLEKIFPLVEQVHRERSRRITTGQLNKFIEACQHKYHPPLIIGKRLRIYYMAQVQTAPPKFVVFVNNPTLMTDTYQKYVVNQFRKEYGFSGCPLILELRGKGPPARNKESGGESLGAAAPKPSLLIDEVLGTRPIS